MKQRGYRGVGGALLGAALALGLLPGAVGGCGEGKGKLGCLGEDVERCTCSGGRSGFMVCALNGSGYSACDCALDASPYLPEAGELEEGGAEAGAGDGGLMFMSSCTPGGPACPPGDACDDFPAKGQFCSHPCSLPTDCQTPSPGCNMMGICKTP